MLPLTLEMRGGTNENNFFRFVLYPKLDNLSIDGVITLTDDLLATRILLNTVYAGYGFDYTRLP